MKRNAVGIPRNADAAPRNAGGAPWSAGGIPRNVGGTPRSVDGTPRSVDGTPRNADATPWNAGGKEWRNAQTALIVAAPIADARSTFTVCALNLDDHGNTETECATLDEALAHLRELIMNELADPQGPIFNRYGLYFDRTYDT